MEITFSLMNHFILTYGWLIHRYNSTIYLYNASCLGFELRFEIHCYNSMVMTFLCDMIMLLTSRFYSHRSSSPLTKYCLLWPVTFSRQPHDFKIRLLERGFYTFMSNASFPSPTNVGYQRPKPTASRYYPLWPIAYRRQPHNFKTRLLERNLQTLVRMFYPLSNWCGISHDMTMIRTHFKLFLKIKLSSHTNINPFGMFFS